MRRSENEELEVELGLVPECLDILDGEDDDFEDDFMVIRGKRHYSDEY